MQYVQHENAGKTGVDAVQRIDDYKAHFNTKLNVCLIDFYSISGNAGVYSKMVNLYTHETLIAWTDGLMEDLKSFQAKEKDLMTQ